MPTVIALRATALPRSAPMRSPAARAAVAQMLARARAFDVKIAGDSPAAMLARNIFDNPKVSDAQILAMRSVTLDQLASPPRDVARTLREVPDVRSLASHRFTVAMLSSVTGLGAADISRVAPDLGLTGSPDTPLLAAPGTDRLRRSTALHDFTDYLRRRGPIAGLNRAVWGVEDRVLSALVSVVEGPR